jgi:hypothetical protein
MGDTWITDLSHFDGVEQDREAPVRAKQLSEYLRRIAKGASHLGVRRDFGILGEVHCRRRPGRKPCGGIILARLCPDDRIEWRCPVCNDNGLISNWHHSIDDESGKLGYPLVLGRELWQKLRALARGSNLEAELAAIQADNNGDYSVTLTLDQLDELWCAASAVADATRDSKKLRVIEELQDALGVAMDGF